MATRKKRAPAKAAAPKYNIPLKENKWEVAGGNLTQHTAFPIPVLKIQWDNVESLNAGLELELYQERARDPVGIYRSNTSNTWHSQTDMFDGRLGKDSSMATLGQLFHAAFNQMAATHGCDPKTILQWSLQGWGMMYSDRGYATCHNHPNAHFAGCYYLTGADGEAEKVMATGDRVKSGTLEFVNPVSHSMQVGFCNMIPQFRVVPQPGLMTIFPAWLNHFVHPVEGDAMRMAIACNGTVRKYKLPSQQEKT